MTAEDNNSQNTDSNEYKSSSVTPQDRRHHPDDYPEHDGGDDDDDDDDDDGGGGAGSVGGSGSGMGSDAKALKRKERLEQNRISARESRKRKKTMIEELQRTVIALSRENKDLNERNEQLRRQLVELGNKVRRTA